MYVVKASGRKEEFDEKKIFRTCIRAGASKKFANEVAKSVKEKCYDGITTREILELTLKFLKKERLGISSRYDLKRAIMCLGPTGFPFEQFFAEILQNYGYETCVRKIFNGKCVEQEVDIAAKKDSIKYMIECKYHNELGIYTGLKVALYTYARFLDLSDKFDKAWLVCNTKLTNEAIKYSNCVGIKITSWHYPEDESLEKLIEKKKLYPITILKSLNFCEKIKVMQANFLLIEDFLRYSKEELRKRTKIKMGSLEKAIEETKNILL
ncbi:MAG: ATP cone domain-containing protein [Candidatus Altiarchaeota archaeon]